MIISLWDTLFLENRGFHLYCVPGIIPDEWRGCFFLLCITQWNPKISRILCFHTKAVTKYEWPDMKRDVRQKCKSFSVPTRPCNPVNVIMETLNCFCNSWTTMCKNQADYSMVSIKRESYYIKHLALYFLESLNHLTWSWTS